MKAIIYNEFGGPLTLTDVHQPSIAPHGALIKVMASGLCRSDWHGWQGHDPDIRSLPHIPGHEFAGIIEAVGDEVNHWKAGQRVISPFVCGCGVCHQCHQGDHQICDNQTQAGFSHWGSFAQYVMIEHADVNLVHLPDQIDFETGASLGCRFATAFRALVQQGHVQADQWVAVHGCGGVGLSAIMIAKAFNAKVIAVDINPKRLEHAAQLGADLVIDGSNNCDVIGCIQQHCNGAQLSIDALGSQITMSNSIGCLAKRGKHIQIGLMAGDDALTPINMGPVIAKELEILGSHGMAAHTYDQMLDMIIDGRLQPQKLISKIITMEQLPQAFMHMNDFTENPHAGMIIMRTEHSS